MQETKKSKPKKSEEPKRSESELVHEQADKMLKAIKLLRDSDQIEKKHSTKTNVDMWKDSDFYFCVVFQSADQKYKFLEAFVAMYNLEIDTDKNDLVQILNGLKLAAGMGIPLVPETVKKYPYPDLELRKLALDNEEF